MIVSQHFLYYFIEYGKFKVFYNIKAFFIIFLDHDLSSSNNRILPPGTKIDFTLTRTRDQFYLMTKPAETGTKPSPADNEQYKAKITSCILYCPIGIMSERLTNEIYTKWESMPIKYFFNRLVVKSLTMPLNKAQFLSGEHISYYFLNLVAKIQNTT